MWPKDGRTEEERIVIGGLLVRGYRKLLFFYRVLQWEMVYAVIHRCWGYACESTGGVHVRVLVSCM